MEAGQGAGSSSKLPSITSVGRVWKSGHPPLRTSCPAGSEGAGSVAGSERVRRAETPLRKIGGAGGERRNSGHLKGAPGARRACQAVQRGRPWRGEKGAGMPSPRYLVWRPGVPKWMGGGDVLEGMSFGRWHGLRLGCYLKIGRGKKKELAEKGGWASIRGKSGFRR